MHYIYLNSRDPYFNLAMEQVAFEQVTEGELLIVWCSSPSIVCGRNQNIFLELNLIDAIKSDVAVLRRDTGGGCVYHDLGNVNFSLITPSDGIGVSYDSYLDRAVSVLNSIGVPAHKNKTCDIAIEGKKISGNAQRQTKTRTLCHGTLLYSADLNRLEAFLPDKSTGFNSKGIASNRSQVANISDYTNSFESVEQFTTAFISAFGGSEYPYTHSLIAKAQEVAREKYRSWDWLLSKNPGFSRKCTINGYELTLESKKGKVTSITVKNADGEWQVNQLEDLPLNPDIIYEACIKLEDKALSQAIFRLIFDYNLEDYR